MNKNRLLTKEEFGKGIQECIDKVKNEMERDEIIRMAQECGLIGMRPHLDGIYQKSLEEFAALVAAREREACAKLVDDNADWCDEDGIIKLTLRSNANAIRARGNEE